MQLSLCIFFCPQSLYGVPSFKGRNQDTIEVNAVTRLLTLLKFQNPKLFQDVVVGFLGSGPWVRELALSLDGFTETVVKTLGDVGKTLEGTTKLITETTGGVLKSIGSTAMPVKGTLASVLGNVEDTLNNVIGLVSNLLSGSRNIVPATVDVLGVSGSNGGLLGPILGKEELLGGSGSNGGLLRNIMGKEGLLAGSGSNEGLLRPSLGEGGLLGGRGSNGGLLGSILGEEGLLRGSGSKSITGGLLGGSKSQNSPYGTVTNMVSEVLGGIGSGLKETTGIVTSTLEGTLGGNGFLRGSGNDDSTSINAEGKISASLGDTFGLSAAENLGIGRPGSNAVVPKEWAMDNEGINYANYARGSISEIPRAMEPEAYGFFL